MKSDFNQLNTDLRRVDRNRETIDAEFDAIRRTISDTIETVKNAANALQSVTSVIEKPTAAALTPTQREISTVQDRAAASAARLEKNKFRLFIHTGGVRSLAPGVVENVVSKLREEGYSDQLPIPKRIKWAAPGVDYFFENDKTEAQAVAVTINSIMPPGGPQLEPRFQKARQQPGTLGVWL